MHVLTRRVGESITIGGAIKVIVLGGNSKKSRLGIIMPEGITIQIEQKDGDGEKYIIMKQ